ncbi:MAG: hypothetical protein PHF63_00320 [Herbinix sp.]|nr:hypothetical protein [Herbinix sp.]
MQRMITVEDLKDDVREELAEMFGYEIDEDVEIGIISDDDVEVDLAPVGIVYEDYDPDDDDDDDDDFDDDDDDDEDFDDEAEDIISEMLGD